MAGHDNGLIVFKLERERPAFSLSNNTLFYIRDKTIRMRDLTSGTDTGVMSVKKLGSQYVQPRSMSYNPAERAVIVTSVSVASSRRGVRARQRSLDPDHTANGRQRRVRAHCSAQGRLGCRGPRLVH